MMVTMMVTMMMMVTVAFSSSRDMANGWVWDPLDGDWVFWDGDWVLREQGEGSINEYKYDRVGVHPTARLIQNLTFRHSQPHEFCRDGYESTVVETPGYFKKKPGMWPDRDSSILRFCHNQFDERNLSQHFDISLSLRWENMLEQDEIMKKIESGTLIE